MPNFKKPMRRRDKSINEISSVYSILKNALVLRLGLCYNSIPYIVPLNFVFDENIKPNGLIYSHSALNGLKIDIIRENKSVCFEVEQDVQIIGSPNPCNWGMKYKSVIGHGKAYFEDNKEIKINVLNQLMEKYSGETSNYIYNDDALDSICIIKVNIGSLTGKKSG
ncbi:pyridoxamine 5'-phosphate oxidase family protein [Methanobacterium alcaliphilum]|uniref:pyridoxamine 5'-phosphate oxidase family protein n=1 Tax=Methanobacterium alcaliphilum TaxID=392018 RepID=UPI00200B47CE|nr:pyridoxamine 5'-phosphate oxidase family protein [Methanobacterium alcaliphilum]MCK9151455.1 pyridoxamine 5'-phosphate oxidase family protein [Methanobacterium alcaliphilum]